MTDYKNLKLIATSNPHIRGSETTRSIMLDVIIAMCPALIWAIIYFGVEALLLTAVSVIGCVVFEGLYRKLMHKPQSIDDLSAVVTGMLLAFVCPATTPLWMILIGDFFAIVVVKQLFGGLGTNFLNPALAGRAFLMLCYPVPMTTWVLPGRENWASVISATDAVTGSTPLSADFMKNGILPDASLADMFIGNIGGSFRHRPAHRRDLPDRQKGDPDPDPPGLHPHRGRADPGLLSGPRGCERVHLDAVRALRRRPVPGCLLHGNRLCHQPQHPQG